MPTSPRQNTLLFTEIFGEFDGAQRVDAGIDPYADLEDPAKNKR